VKAIRIAQVVALVLLAFYLWVFHNVNAEFIRLPLLPSMPPALVVLVTIALTWLITWLPARARLWNVKRRLRQVTAERDELVQRLSPYAGDDPDSPVIPDRIDPYDTSGGGERDGKDPTDYL
jgi:hypothetical protein